MRYVLFLLFVFSIEILTKPLSAATCDETGLIDNCTFTPDAMKYTVLAVGLCKGLPSEPTTSVPADFSGCELVYDKISQNGQEIELTGAGQQLDIAGDLRVPKAGTYDYFLFAYANGLYVKKSWSLTASASAYRASQVITSGVNCWTINENWLNNDQQLRFAFECGATMGSPEYTFRDFWASNGVASNACGGKDYWINGDYTAASDWNTTAAIVSLKPTDAPVIITDATKGISVKLVFTNSLSLDTDSYYGDPGIFVSTVSVPCAGGDISAF